MITAPGSCISLEWARDTGNQKNAPLRNSLESNRMMRPCYEYEASGFLSLLQNITVVSKSDGVLVIRIQQIVSIGSIRC